ncbi:MAG: glycosyltransferase [Porphyromonas sp.]|nr:glycosyltransferase [Porphyromonas sp.]
MTDIKVSICVPVYNTAQYLRTCVDSLRNQTLREIEIILVDDGSTDESPAICDEYAASDDRIRVIHKENGGLGSARQVGLDIAQGEFLICCDSDDWVELHMYETLYNYAKTNQVDIVICDYYHVVNSGERTAISQGLDNCDAEYLLRCLLMGEVLGSACFKLVSLEFIRKHSLYWEPGVNQGEDFLMSCKLFLNKPRIAYLPQPMYNYRIAVSGSYTNNIRAQSFLQLSMVVSCLASLLPMPEYKSEFFTSCVRVAGVGLRAEGLSASAYRAYCAQYLPWGELLAHKPTPRSLIAIAGKVAVMLGGGAFSLLQMLVQRVS